MNGRREAGQGEVPPRVRQRRLKACERTLTRARSESSLRRARQIVRETVCCFVRGFRGQEQRKEQRGDDLGRGGRILDRYEVGRGPDDGKPRHPVGGRAFGAGPACGDHDVVGGHRLGTAGGQRPPLWSREDREHLGPFRNAPSAAHVRLDHLRGRAASLFKAAHVDVNAWSYGVVILAIIVDFSRSRALSRVAKKTRSAALEADALHFSSDIYSSLVVLAGLVATQLGYPQADAFAALGVSLFVIWISIQLRQEGSARPHGPGGRGTRGACPAGGSLRARGEAGLRRTGSGGGGQALRGFEGGHRSRCVPRRGPRNHGVRRECTESHLQACGRSRPRRTRRGRPARSERRDRAPG